MVWTMSIIQNAVKLSTRTNFAHSNARGIRDDRVSSYKFLPKMPK